MTTNNFKNKSPVEKKIGDLLIKKGLSISVAESCTGGLVSSRLTDVSGSSEYIFQNIVTYSNDAKIKCLNVNVQTLDEFGAVSEQTAKEMAEGVRTFSNTDIGLSTTGIAGPTGGTQEKPVGLVYIGVSLNTRTLVHKHRSDSNLSRKAIKRETAQKALELLYECILDSD